MSKYAIAWTEFFDNNIAVEFYEVDSAFEAAKQCWKVHMMDGVKDESFLARLKKQFENFSSIESIQEYFWDCDENISEPILITN